MSNLRDKARDLRKNMTDAERRLWSNLRNNQLGARFRRQAPIGPYIADFACFDPRLIIEVDGGQHDEQRAYDARRSDWLMAQGFSVLRFWNNEVLENGEGVLEVILKELMILRGSPPHPNPPPQGGREKEDAASLRHLVTSANPPPQGGKEGDDSAASHNTAPSPWMGDDSRAGGGRAAPGAAAEGWEGGAAPQGTADARSSVQPPQGGRRQQEQSEDGS